VESTGSYHELFADAAAQLGFLVFLLNPKDTRRYAKAVGLRGKTDRVDSELIARMIAHGHTSAMQGQSRRRCYVFVYRCVAGRHHETCEQRTPVHRSITLSERSRTACGIVTPISRAVSRFTANVTLLSDSTGRF
jgi:hypothetical protein